MSAKPYNFKPGDRVLVLDPGLAELRRLMASFGKKAEPNHHGTVDEVGDDYVLVNFDDGVAAPYPYADVRHLPVGSLHAEEKP